MFAGIDPEKCHQRNRLSMFAKVLDCLSQPLLIVVNNAKHGITLVAEKFPNLSRSVVVVNAEVSVPGMMSGICGSADSAPPTLAGKHPFIFGMVDTEVSFQPVVPLHGLMSRMFAPTVLASMADPPRVRFAGAEVADRQLPAAVGTNPVLRLEPSGKGLRVRSTRYSKFGEPSNNSGASDVVGNGKLLAGLPGLISFSDFLLGFNRVFHAAIIGQLRCQHNG